METPLIDSEVIDGDVCEVRIIAGLSPQDVDKLLHMAEASGLFGSEEMSEVEDMSWGCAYQGDDSACQFLQAVIVTPDGEKLIGFLCYSEIPHWPLNYELYGLAVTPEYQRLGIGSALVTEMKRKVAALGGRRIFLETGQDRTFEKARLFYEANDYTMEYRFFKQFIPKDNSVVYCHTLELNDEDSNLQ